MWKNRKVIKNLTELNFNFLIIKWMQWWKSTYEQFIYIHILLTWEYSFVIFITFILWFYGHVCLYHITSHCSHLIVFVLCIICVTFLCCVLRTVLYILSKRLYLHYMIGLCIWRRSTRNTQIIYKKQIKSNE